MECCVPLSSRIAALLRRRTSPLFGDGAGRKQEEVFCMQMLSLLASVSGTAVCQAEISSPRWMRLLLALVVHGSPRVQLHTLRLLRRLLPGLSPADAATMRDTIRAHIRHERV